MDRTNGFSRTVHLDPARPAMDQIRAACAKAKELRGGQDYDTFVCTDALWDRLKAAVPAEIAAQVGLTRCYGMVVHAEPDAFHASQLSQKLLLEGKRVILVME